MNNIAESIRAARISRDLTQHELGEKVGVCQSTISCYERGSVSPSVAMVDRIEVALNTPLTTPVFRPEKGRRLYIAYGSNLSLEQMSYRCPDAYPVGRAVIPDYRLVFRSVLSIEPHKGSEVPVVIWSISKLDEKNLDIYEGFPKLYRKETLHLQMELFLGPKVTVDGIVYIMNEGRYPLAAPSDQYYSTCAEGYRRFGFDEGILWSAHGITAAPVARRGKGRRYYA